jgi:hypothetical protein
MTTIGHVFIPLDREHDGVVPTGEDRAHFESLPVPLALWQSFEECLSDHLSELSEGQIDRDEKFWFEAAHVNAMIAVVEAEAVAAAPELRDWLISLVAFARGRTYGCGARPHSAAAQEFRVPRNRARCHQGRRQVVHRNPTRRNQDANIHRLPDT